MARVRALPRAPPRRLGVSAHSSAMFSRDIAGHSVVHHWNRLSNYRLSQLCGQGETRPWPRSTDLCCWHCTEPFDTQPVGIPIELQGDSKIVCDGNFCSYSCALAHTFSSGATHREYRTKQLLTQVAREIHGLHTVVSAPPRLALSKFGGPLSIKEFRETGSTHSIVINPPYVSQDVVYEESVGENETTTAERARDQWSVERLQIPEQPLSASEVMTDSEPLQESLFDAFREERMADATAAADTGGTLSQFMR